MKLAVHVTEKRITISVPGSLGGGLNVQIPPIVIRRGQSAHGRSFEDWKKLGTGVHDVSDQRLKLAVVQPA